MKTYFDTFRQSKLRAWVWFFLMIISGIMSMFALFTGFPAAAFSNVVFGAFVYWIDKLEKEITRRNKQPFAPPHDDNKRAEDGA